jgi:NADPH2:quinone reductase
MPVSKRKMQAILIPKTFTPNPSTLAPTNVPLPQPKPDEYLVQISHCSPQHADILHAKGTHQNVNAKKGNVHPPFILGYDFAGTIEGVPSSSSYSPSNPAGNQLKKGDLVFGASIGAFAEYIAVKANRVRKIPKGVSNRTACAVSGQAVSYAAVAHVAKTQPGDTVLVSGASGGLGSACCMVAKALGARVIALAGDESKAADMRRDMDVDLVVVSDSEGWKEKVLEFTGGQGVEAVFDNTGMVNEAIRCVAYGGTIVILGFAGRRGVMEEVKMNRLLLKGVTLVGYRFGENGRRFPEELEQVWDGWMRMLVEGNLKPLIYGRYDGLKSVGRALEDLAQRKVYGKVVVSVIPDEEKARL